MIPVARVPEPPGWPELRERGEKWLAENPDSDRLPKHWRHVIDELAEGFRHLCGYTAQYDSDGCVDHFHCVERYRNEAYDWSNFRYASTWFNSSKGTLDLLDPHDVKEGWFKILLPSYELVLVADKVPPEFREIAAMTVKKLNLASDGRLLRIRATDHRRYLRHCEEKGEAAAMHILRQLSPLLADAVEREKMARRPRVD